MSFLAPWYILAGVAAVSLPILFHMLRRTPRGRQPFSSLMFLQPSPPRLTRRSRLENWPLLLLRALLLILLALAFGRPFLRQAWEMLLPVAPGERVVVLLDSSASMRRGDLWNQAKSKAQEVIDNLQPEDQAALYTFDLDPRGVVSLEQWQAAQPTARPELIRSELAGLQPTWATTRLDRALTTAVEMLEQEPRSGETSRPVRARRIVLISDLQTGSRLDALQSYEWPPDVRVTVESLKIASPSNASVQWVQSASSESATLDAERPRVRISNAADSQQEQFQLTWKSQTVDSSPATAEALQVYVPPGQSRVMRGPKLPAGRQAGQLQLTGDAHDFDNALWLVPLRSEQVVVGYLGEDQAADTQGLLYYLQRAFPPTFGRSVRVQRVSEATGGDLLELEQSPLVVVSEAKGKIEWLQKKLQRGQTVLWVLTDVQLVGELGQLLKLPQITAEETSIDGYAMLSDMKRDHPLFTPFADPRFGDFTKIHIWHHRHLWLDSLLKPESPTKETSTAEKPTVQVLARFDDGQPALLEITQGPGIVWVLTTSWKPTDSQLALSSKFVPLLNQMLSQCLGIPAVLPRYEVGEAVELVALGVKPQEKIEEQEITTPAGIQVKLKSEESQFTHTTEPGIYTLRSPTGTRQFAVNIASTESNTAPLPVETLEGLGVQVVRAGQSMSLQTVEDLRRQLHSHELENRQRMWQWVLAAVMMLLIVETLWAAHSTRRQASVDVQGA